MADTLILSVVIITCNRKEELLKAIRSCLEHTIKPFELIIVDNNSKDNTEVAVREFCAANNILLKYEYLNENTGVSHARNIGYAKASGDILFFIDDDAVIVSKTKSLDNVAEYMRAHNDVMACTGGSIDYRFGGYMAFIRDKRDKKQDMYVVRSYVGFNHFIKKGFSGRDYIYPNNLFYGSEELYVGLTILRYEGKCVYISEHEVQHNPSMNTRIDRREAVKNGHINTFVIKKYFLPKTASVISSILFTLRICKFCKGNIKEIIECNKKVKQRYDKAYENKISYKNLINAIRRFGVKKIL